MTRRSRSLGWLSGFPEDEGQDRNKDIAKLDTKDQCARLATRFTRWRMKIEQNFRTQVVY
jgi:hypothetical protein